MDGNAPPTSADVSYDVTPPYLYMDFRNFTFADADSNTYHSIIIETLPTGGRLRIHERRTGGPCNQKPSNPYCQKFTPVTAGMEIATAYTSPWNKFKLLLVDSFDSNFENTSFDFKVKDNTNAKSTTYTVTLKKSGLPDWPTAFAVTTDDGQATLSWTKPADPPGDPVTKHQVRWETYFLETLYEASPWTDVAIVQNQSDYTHTFTGLINQAAYYFRARAVNNAGGGPAAGTAGNTRGIRVQPALAAPAGLTASPETGKAVLGLDGPEQLRNITSYQYQMRTPNTQELAEVRWQAPSSSIISTITEWEYKLWKVGGGGGLTAIPGDTEVALEWTATADTNVTKWQYRHKLSSANWPTTSPFGWTEVPSSTRTTVNYTKTGLTNGTAYDFEVRPYTTSAQTKLDTVTATPGWTDICLQSSDSTCKDRTSHRIQDSTLVSGSKYHVQIRYKVSGTATDVDITATTALATTDSSGNVTIEWVAASGATGYEYRTKKDADAWSAWADAGTGTTKSVTGLTASTDYLVQVRATKANEEYLLADALADTSTLKVSAGMRWPSAWTDISGSGATTITHDVTTGLTDGATYEFRIRARKGTGANTLNGNPSAGASLTLPTAVPAKPAGLKATPKHQSAALSWTNPNDSAIYKWQYSSDNGTNWSDVPSSSATTASYTVAGLTNGTSYTFKVRAVNYKGASTASDGVAATPVGVPAKPTGFSAIGQGTTCVNYCKDDQDTTNDVKEGSVQLTWDNPSNTTITGWQYRVKWSVDPYGGWTNIPSSSPTTTSHTVENLKFLTPYTFQIRAVNSAGNGAESDTASSTVLKRPGAPAISTATAGNRAVTLTWTAPLTNADAARRYQYQYKTTGAYGAWQSWSIDTVSPTIVSALTGNAAHTFRIRALNTRGEPGAASNEATATPSGPPAAPTGLSAQAGNKTLRVSWTAPTGHVNPITGYEYRTKLASASWPATGAKGWTSIGGSGAATTTADITVASNASYDVQIRAVNADGKGAAASVSETAIAVPAIPTGLTADAYGTQADLTWTDPSDTSIAKYEYSKDDGTTWTQICLTSSDSDCPTETSHTVGSLTRAATYTILLRAVNSAGNGLSASVAAALAPAKPAGLTAALINADTDTSVDLSWTNPSDSSITGYQMSQRTGNGADFVVGTGSSQTITLEWTNPTSDSVTVTHFRYRADGDLRWKIIPCPSGCNVAKQTSYDLTFTLNAGTRVAYQVQGYEIRFAGEDPYTEHPVTGVKMWENIPNSGAATTSHAVPNLSYGETRDFEVRAVNANGAGPASAAQVSTRPAKPTGFTAAARVQSADLSWTDTKNTTINGWQMRQWTGSGADFVVGSGAIGQKITLSWTASSTSNITAWQYSTDGSNWTDICETSSNSNCPTTTSHTITTSTALTSGTPYTYQVQAAVSTGTAPTVTNLQAWETVSTNAEATSHTAAGLANGTAYNFIIRAVNNTGVSDFSDQKTATPGAGPHAPAGLSASARDKGAVLSWYGSLDQDFVGYEYQQKTGGAWGTAWTPIASSSRSTASHAITGLTNGTAYTFRIRALNSYGAAPRPTKHPPRP